MKTVRFVLTLVFSLLGAVFLALGLILYAAYSAGSDDPALALLATFFALVGALFFLGIIISRWIIRTLQQRRLALLDYGIRVDALVTEVRRNRSVEVNGRHPYRVWARCVHPVTHQEVTMHSHNLWRCTVSPGDTVTVAFDQMNETRFAFDLHEPEE